MASQLRSCRQRLRAEPVRFPRMGQAAAERGRRRGKGPQFDLLVKVTAKNTRG